MSATDIVLRVEHVSKRFFKGEMHDSLRDLIPALIAKLLGRHAAPPEQRDFWALQDVSFELARGEALGIVGSNGAGKSTMLKLITGVMKPTTGQLKVNGRLSALIEVGAGFHLDLTGRENIYLNGAILGMSRAEIDRKFEAIVDFSGLREFIDMPVKRYSTGMYARLGFSVAAHVDPDILIVDEVLSVGDIVFQNRCLERMNSVIRGGASVIFVSHNLRAITELCHRAVLLEHGRVIQSGPSEQIVKTYLERSAEQNYRTPTEGLAITKVSVRGPRGDGVAFDSGDKIWVEVEVVCRSERSEPFSVVLFLNDDQHYQIFHTSTEYLGQHPVSLEEGERFFCTFELDLHLGGGKYDFGAVLYRFNVQKNLDRVFPAATIFVSSNASARGAVNLNPKISRIRSLPRTATKSAEAAVSKG